MSLAELIRNAKTCLGLNQVRCAHCFRPFFEDNLDTQRPSLHICPQCGKFLEPYIGPRCLKCGVPAGSDLPSQNKGVKIVCPTCEETPPPWQHIAYHGLYAGPLRDMLLRLKFDGELHLARVFADLLLEAASCLPKPDMLAAIPQFPVKLRARGYNQAHEIARALARKIDLKLESALLARIKPGMPQESLNAVERRINLKNAFEASPKCEGKVVWLVDDIMTTGSTCAEATQALLAKKASRVCVLFVARTPLP